MWAIPADPGDLAPLPVLLFESKSHEGCDVFPFDRHDQRFDMDKPLDHTRALRLYSTFEECRSAMIEQWSNSLSNMNRNVRHVAGVIEHLRAIPTQPFPNVLPEVSEPQAFQEEKTQEKVETTKVTAEPAKRLTVKGKSNG